MSIPRLSFMTVILAVLMMYVGYKWGAGIFSKVGL